MLTRRWRWNLSRIGFELTFKLFLRGFVGGWWVGVENEINANLSFQLSCSWSWSLSLATTTTKIATTKNNLFCQVVYLHCRLFQLTFVFLIKVSFMLAVKNVPVCIRPFSQNISRFLAWQIFLCYQPHLFPFDAKNI